jgi:tetratricopeptide (TPR) repeat protein
LNTDHSSNLARLYSWWSGRTAEAAARSERGQQSSDYYATALMLSPNNATLWGEWGSLLMNLNRLDEAYQKIDHALSLDPTYGMIHALAGDYYDRLSRTLQDPAAITDTLRLAAQQYGLAGEARGDATSRANYYIAQGNLYLRVGDFHLAAQAFENTLALNPNTSDLWRIEETIAQVYLQIGEKELALQHAQNALTAAADEQKGAIQALIEQIQSLP